MEEKRCSLCSTVITEYPCPMCGYDGELDRPEPAVLPQEELELPKKAVKKAPAKKKKKKKGSSVIGWLLVIILVLLAGMAAFVWFTVHIWTNASCTAPQTCRICKKTQGEPLPHNWLTTACDLPGICSDCKAVQDQAIGHTWVRDDCLSIGICSVCGEQETEAPGHDWLEADCLNPRRCARCGQTEGIALGHSWDGNTQNPVCSRCGQALSEEEQSQTLLEMSRQSVFEALFAAPDWKALYQTAGMQNTAFEGADQLADYMNSLTGEITCLPSEDGSPACQVLLGDTPIAEFTLKQTSGSGWELDSLTFNLEHPVSITVQALEGHTVYVNGYPLDSAYLTDTAATAEAAYLPEGTPGVKLCTWQVKDLLMEPSVSVQDASHKDSTVIEDNGTYYEQSQDDTLSDSEQSTVFAALESYAEYMIQSSGSRNNVLKYYESGTKVCTSILNMGSELWMNSDHGHKFTEETILAARRYTDSLFAVRARIVMNTTLKDGPTRDYIVEETMFFRPSNGKWVCFAMTNRDVLTVQTRAEAEDEWADYPDGIRIESYTGENFNAHIMLIRDASRVYMGLSSYNGFSTSKPGKRLTQAIADEGAVAAINAGAFNDNGTADITVGSIPAGLVIYEGEIASNTNKGQVPEKGFCGLDADGRLVVTDSMTTDQAKELNIQYGCEFGPVLIQNSKVNEEACKKEGYNPRTAVGQRADGTILFVCADGRQAGSLGATYGQLIDLLVEYGAVNACNMDGGSSTVMLTRDSEGKVEFVNSYSVLQSYPRRMPNFWMVRPAQ